MLKTKLLRISLLSLLCLTIMSGCKPQKQWYKGQLHSHNYWSDGRAFPEQAVQAYKIRGYDFMCMTDHNRFANNPDHWRVIHQEEETWPPNVTQVIFDQYVNTFGEEWVETKKNGEETLVRLKTYDEIKEKFEIPGEFILMPGVEVTLQLPHHAPHLNYINIPEILPNIKDANLIHTVKDPLATASKMIQLNSSEAQQAAQRLKTPHITMVNHPFWIYYDILPQNLIDCPDMRFFEICNGGSDYKPHPEALSYTADKFWDIVNAFRLSNNQQLLYGVGTDDAHFYDEKRIHGIAGVGDAWVMVHAESLTPESLLAAMDRGDFYATSGVILDDVSFDAKSKTLRVKVKAAKGVTYKINFITTKKDFNTAVVRIINSPTEGKRPARTIPIYSDDIGRIVKVVDGAAGEYKMADDDLYVRARIESNVPSQYSINFHATVKTAWTQPFASTKK